jgi:hypothetical protein
MGWDPGSRRGHRRVEYLNGRARAMAHRRAPRGVSEQSMGRRERWSARFVRWATGVSNLCCGSGVSPAARLGPISRSSGKHGDLGGIGRRNDDGDLARERMMSQSGYIGHA